MGATSREYNFFVTTNSHHQPDGMDRGLIRRLVMRNFFDTRYANAQVDTCASAHTSANTVLAKKQLKNRFRLADVGAETKKIRKGSGNKSKASDQVDTNGGNEKEIAAAVKKKRPKATRTTTSTSTSTSKSASISPTSVFPGWQALPSTRTQSLPHTGFCQNPSTQILDPFDVLPIPNSPHLTFLFKLCMSPSPYLLDIPLSQTPTTNNTKLLSPKLINQLPNKNKDKSTTPLNALATNPSSSWWSFISCSAALLHATLATWALYGLLVCKQVEGLNLAEWGLRHKSEAIAGVNRGVKAGSMGGGRRGSGVSEEVIGCVVVVASFEVCIFIL